VAYDQRFSAFFAALGFHQAAGPSLTETTCVRAVGDYCTPPHVTRRLLSNAPFMRDGDEEECRGVWGGGDKFSHSTSSRRASVSEAGRDPDKLQRQGSRGIGQRFGRSRTV